MNLSQKLRPNNLDEIVGQGHIVKILKTMVLKNQFLSMVFYGMPGVGKTSIARALAGSFSCKFVSVNAGVDDKKSLVCAVEECSDKENPGILFIDEIHRLDKTKQDYLLSFLESGVVRIIGATTENPFMSLRPAIRSRMQIFELKPLSAGEIFTALQGAVSFLGIEVEAKVLEAISTRASGDLRFAYQSLEFLSLCHPDDIITMDVMSEAYQRRNIEGDTDGDIHYDLLSALQKSIRGSDVDAALYYLAHLIEIGDLISLVRRLTVILYEDIGLANPDIFTPVIQAIDSASRLGLPEARIPLSVVTIMMSLSAKSNEAYIAIDKALSDVGEKKLVIPQHLRDGHYKGAKSLGRSVGYLYPHDYSNHIVLQQYRENNEVKYLDFTNFSGEKISKWMPERLSNLRTFLTEKGF